MLPSSEQNKTGILTKSVCTLLILKKQQILGFSRGSPADGHGPQMVREPQVENRSPKSSEN